MAATLHKVTVGTSSTTVVPVSTALYSGSRSVRFVNRSQVPVTLGNGDVLGPGGEATFTLPYTSSFTCTAPATTTLEVYDDRPAVGPTFAVAAASDIVNETLVVGDAYPRFRMLADGLVQVSDGSRPLTAGGVAPFGIPTRSGEMNTDVISSTNLTMTSQRMWLSGFTTAVTEPVTSVTVWTTGTAAGATPTLVRFGIYEVDSTFTTATLVASTANDTALLAAINTRYSKALSATYQKTRGRYLVCAALVVTGATAPTLSCRSSSSPNATIQIGSTSAFQWLGGHIDSQSDLPATFALTNVVTTSGSQQVFIELAR